MAFSLDQYKNVMREIEQPTGVDAVRAIRDRFLDARELVEQREADIHAAAGNRGVALEPLYQRLAAAKDEMLLAQREFQRIGQYGTSLEAQALANQQQKMREAEAKKQEDAQLKANEAEKASYKEELWPGYLAAGYTRAEFEKHFNEPVSGLWARRVDEKVARREREIGQAWKDRYHSFHL